VKDQRRFTEQLGVNDCAKESNSVSLSKERRSYVPLSLREEVASAAQKLGKQRGKSKFLNMTTPASPLVHLTRPNPRSPTISISVEGGDSGDSLDTYEMCITRIQEADRLQGDVSKAQSDQVEKPESLPNYFTGAPADKVFEDEQGWFASKQQSQSAKLMIMERRISRKLVGMYKKSAQMYA
jgi:hypothetical protein